MSRLPAGRRGSGGDGKGGQDLVVEEVGERAVPDVVEEAGHPQRLDDQALRRGGRPGGDAARAQARIERPRPESRLVHHAQTVGEPRVLGGREDPSGALELADPAEPLDPRRVEQVLLGDRPRRAGPAAPDSAGVSRLVSSM